MLDIDNMSFDEIENFIDGLVDSPEFDRLSQEFFGDLVESDNDKEARQDFDNYWGLGKR